MKVSLELLIIYKCLTIKEFAVVYCHTSNTTNELEISEVLLITHARIGVDLQGVVVPVMKAYN